MALVDRVKGILLTPAKEWRVIEPEAARTGGLFTGYVLPLAALPPIASFVGTSVVGVRMMSTTMRVTTETALKASLAQFVFSLASVYLLALIVDALAPTFGATRNAMQALKLSIYSCTAVWVAGIFAILPGTSALTLLGLYSIYLLYLGLPVMMKAPADKQVAYTVVTAACAVGLFYALNSLSRNMFGFGMY